MNRMVLPALLCTVMAVGLAQTATTCTVRYTPPDYPELPAGRPSAYISLNKAITQKGDFFTVRGWTSSPSTTAWVRVSWTGSTLALGNSPSPPLTSVSYVQGCPEATLTTRPLTYRDNGWHNFLVQAYVYWKEWYTVWTCTSQETGATVTTTVQGYGPPGYPYTNCSYVRGYWQPTGGVVTATDRGASYISWEQELSYDQVLQELASRIREEHRRITGAFRAYAYAKEIPDPLRGPLSDAARGYFYNCNWLGICDRADPAGEIKYLTDVPSMLSGLLATGRLCGGFITFCFGAQNARGADIGPEVEVKTFLMVKGGQHDYLLLDRLIPRKYYDPTDRDYPGVPEEERRQVLSSCRTYKDTQEGRRCLALVEAPTGIVGVLKGLLLIDPMFNRGRQYP